MRRPQILHTYAGAIILAKTQMTELANWVAGAPTPMPTNYNAIHGYGMNPYDPRRDPRTTADGRPVLQTGGSSSGIGTAANFWAGNVGTETSGSILSPANQNMLAAIKPTVGRISRYGVIPITADQDTPGPMARTVADAAVIESIKKNPGKFYANIHTAEFPGGAVRGQFHKTKAFDVKFQNTAGEVEHAWATSWGVSTRLIGGLVMTHSDDQGLVLPPRNVAREHWSTSEQMAVPLLHLASWYASAGSAMSQPAPAAGPFTAAITG